MSNHMTPPTVPAELIFELPGSMLDSRKIEQRIQPYSQSKYTSGNSQIKFTIPQTDRNLAAPQTMYITGKLLLNNVTAAYKYAILGSYYSLFSRQTWNANGTVLETIDRPGELVNMLINMTMNSAEKLAQSNSLGCAAHVDVDSTSNISLTFGSTDSTIPVKLANPTDTTGKVYMSFAIPLIGVLDSVKYVPMWNSNLELELTTNDIKNWLTPINDLTPDITNALNAITFELSELELVFDSIELSPESFNMVMANYPQKVVLKTQSYLFGASTSFSGIGSVDIPINARLNSLKQLFFYFTRTTLADQSFGGINPNGNDVVFITNGKTFPQRAIKLSNPSECYMQVQKSFGSIKSYSHSGCMGKMEFCRRSTANELYWDPVTKKSDLRAWGGNKFYLAIDTEIINTNKNTLYNGIQTGVNSNIRLNIGDTIMPNDAVICYYWCCYDILLEFDFLTGITKPNY